MVLLTPRSTPTYTLLPYTTLFPSSVGPTSSCSLRPPGSLPSGLSAPPLRPTGGSEAQSPHAPWSLDGRRTRGGAPRPGRRGGRSEEHTSELQSLMRISYAVFCLKNKNIQKTHHNKNSNRLNR